VCKENVNVQMLGEEDLKRIVDGDFLLRLHCMHCGSIKDFRPGAGRPSRSVDQWETNGPDER